MRTMGLLQGGFFAGVKPAVGLSLALSLTLAPVALAGQGDLNSTNTGRDVQGGTYFNTSGSRTTFENPGGSLWVRSDQLVRGLESDANKVPTGNGGTLYFRAPGNVIRIDGTIDASAVKNGSVYLGNGGKVFMDSAYLFQSGNIFANGFNGGLVQFNVGAATIAPTARITAQGFGGNGGAIVINSPGMVDIQSGAVIDTSGKVIGTFDTNVINIEGGVVNNRGIIRANGVATTDFNTAPLDAGIMAANPQLASNPAPGTISAGQGQGIIMGAPAPHQVPAAPANRGGTIRLVATGQNYNASAAINASDVLTSTEKTSILNTQAQLSNAANNGTIINNGTLSARGGAEQDGGTIMLAAANDVLNFGTLDVMGGNGRQTATGGTNGGDGGTIAVAAMDRINNQGIITATGGNGGNANSVSLNSGNSGPDTVQVTTSAGTGGNGGMIVFSYKTMESRGKITADGGIGGNGGHASILHSVTATAEGQNVHSDATAIAGNGGQGGKGGLIILAGDANPTGGGLLQANGGRGGTGGNAVADARAIARDTGGGTATVNTNPVRGLGGTGGAVGTVIAPTPGSLSSTMLYLAQAGGAGNSGTQQHLRTTRQNGVTTVNNSFEGAIAGSRTTGPHNTILATRRNELAVHAENAILLSRNGGAGSAQTNFSSRLNASLVRTVDNPAGVSGISRASAEPAGNLMIFSTEPLDLTLDFSNNNADPIFHNLSTLTVLNNGLIDNNMHWAPGTHQVGGGFHDSTFSLGGGHTTFISSGSIVNDGVLMSRGLWTGGTITLAAAQDITNNRVMINTAFNKHTASGFTPTPGYISSHSGGITLKAGRDIINNHIINDKEAFFDIHPAFNRADQWPRFLNAAQIGSTLYLQAGNNIVNNVGDRISAEAITYRDTTRDDGANNPAFAIGGIMNLKAGNLFTNNGFTSVDAQSWRGSTGNFKFTSLSGLTEVESTDGDLIIE